MDQFSYTFQSPSVSVQGVSIIATSEPVVTVVTVQSVTAGSAVERIVTLLAAKVIVAVATFDGVIAGSAVQQVVVSTAEQCVVARFAHD